VAVARDLFARSITSPAHLAAVGMSNGGLLVGNMLVRHPELFGAIVCESPLLDLRLYKQRQAGASWVSELGDPDRPEDWAYMKDLSPFQNVRADVRYPPVLVTTSTSDDRVGPLQAREMAAKLEATHHTVSFYESREGGHAGAVSHSDGAFLRALVYTFLWRHVL
jgi:prolyl oligopeptidase